MFEIWRERKKKFQLTSFAYGTSKCYIRDCGVVDRDQLLGWSDACVRVCVYVNLHLFSF